MVNPEIGANVNAGGIATNYHERGSGEDLLLIHGSGPGVTAWANWRANIDALGADFHVIAPDIVGFGYTERPKKFAYGKETWLAHLTDFLDALGLARVSMVGNSFGGALALAMATSAPQRVNKLVLMGSVGLDFELTDGLDQVWGYQPSLANMEKLLKLFSFNQDLLGGDLARLRFEASTREGVQESYSVMFPEPRQAAITALATTEERISSISHPTLVIHGRQDQVIPLSNSLRLSELIANCELHVFDRCGHWTQIEKRERFNTLVRDFLLA